MRPPIKKSTKVGLTALLLIAVIKLISREWSVSPQVKEPSYARLQEPARCGRTTLTQTERESMLATFAIRSDNFSEGVEASLARNISALPDYANKLFKTKRLKFGLLNDAAKVTQKDPDHRLNDVYGRPISVLEESETGSINLFMAPDLDLSDKILQQGISAIGHEQVVRGIDESLLPVSFWLIFEYFWNTQPERGVLADSVASTHSLFGQLKSRIAGLMKFEDAEVNYYFQEFLGSGTANPNFATRTLVLIAANTYCSQETYDILRRDQKDALQLFESKFLCLLGKPYFMSDLDFQKKCVTR